MKKSVIEIKKQIESLEIRLTKIRDKCKHINAEKKYGANTGNFDPNDDCYWIDFACLECGKRWHEQQGRK